jgi:hypothetical protein
LILLQKFIAFVANQEEGVVKKELCSMFVKELPAGSVHQIITFAAHYGLFG